MRKRRKSKKGFEIAWNSIVYALLAIIVILVVWFIFKTGSGHGLKSLLNISDEAKEQSKGEKCAPLLTGNYCMKKEDSSCKEGYVQLKKEDCERCCVSQDFAR